ncbi:MAG TPA: glycosyltransferase family 2 protein [Verrucomicrobiae bacterium]|nr:glycosyltransferase family 2 protein [Verrucomicrobiae bacterium]
MTAREMKNLPLISIAVPSFNQGRFIRETLQSLVDQQYPNLEVIIQDGGSTDGAVEIAREFAEREPHIFKLFVEKDTGHAQAVNRAFRRANGEILGYLNTDDTLYPGCLHRVAQEISPSRGRNVVFGRCLFTGEGSPYVGAEHPSKFTSHFDHLAIWKRGYNTIPQPATFWHRRVYERCGGFDENHNHGLDYLQWCKFSRDFVFHGVDELWATYRMHSASVSANKTEQDWLEIMTRYSRMHWGPWWHPLRWRCEISHWIHGQHRHERACHHARRAEQAWDRGQFAAAVWETIRTGHLSPRMAWHRLLQPVLADKTYSGLVFLLFQKTDDAASAFVGKYNDNWVGPVYRQTIEVPHPQTEIMLVLEHVPQPRRHHSSIEVVLLINGRAVAREKRSAGGQFGLKAIVDKSTNSGTVELELRTRPYFIPRLVSDAADDRKLAVLLLETIVRRYQPPRNGLRPLKETERAVRPRDAKVEHERPVRRGPGKRS